METHCHRPAKSDLDVVKFSDYGSKGVLRMVSASWPSSVTRVALLILAASCAIHVSCSNGRQTEDPDSPVVKLRNELKRLAVGELNQVVGNTPAEHSFVLLFGYQGSIESLPVSERVQRELNELTHWDYERYVLVEVVGEEVKQYTVWEAGDDPQLTPMPFLIRGEPFRITAVQREPYRVTIRLE